MFLHTARGWTVRGLALCALALPAAAEGEQAGPEGKAPETGFVRICKVAGPGVEPGTPFRYTVAGHPHAVAVQAGPAAAPGCTEPIEVPAGEVRITEAETRGVAVQGFTVHPAGRLRGPTDATRRFATVLVVPGGPDAATTLTVGGTRIASRFPGLALDRATARRLARLERETLLAGGRLRVVNLYGIQALILHESRGEPRERVVERLVREVYTPHAEFWRGYLGDEARFRTWASEKLLSDGHPIRERIEPLVRLDLPRHFTEAVEWMEDTTGRRPQGTWYLVFGPGWTDMGGLGGSTMLADFTQMKPEAGAIARVLPHELTHLVHGPSPARRGDPDAGTVLDRLVSEGFASYVAWVHGVGRLTPAQALGYTAEEWEAALAREGELFAAARPHLSSTRREDLDRFSSRSQRLVPAAPTATGYFLGFRMVQAYVAKHGPDSWKEIYDLPVRKVLARSGYAPGGQHADAAP